MSEELVVNFIQPGRTITHTYKLSEVFQKQERRNLEIIVKLVVKADSHSMNEIYKPNLSQQATLTILGGKGGKEGVIRCVITRGERTPRNKNNGQLCSTQKITESIVPQNVRELGQRSSAWRAEMTRNWLNKILNTLANRYTLL